MTRSMTALIKFNSPRVGDRGRSPRGGVSRALRSRFAALAVGALALSACAATQDSAAVAPTAPGFLLGLWHGFIFPVAWIVSLFFDKVAVYAVPNNGGWYDFGYFLGIVVFGVGARKGTRVVYRDRNVIDVKAKRVEELNL
jgi:hypothetical protein